jgi:hypothetical protein
MPAQIKNAQARRLAICRCGFSILAMACAEPAHAAVARGAITYVTLGYADPNGKVPVVNGVPGAGVSNVAFPLPLRAIRPGYRYAIAIGSQNFSFSGTCSTQYVLTGTLDGKPKLIATARTAGYACGPKAVSPRFFTTPKIPDYKGAASLEAIVTFGESAVKRTVNLLIE